MIWPIFINVSFVGRTFGFLFPDRAVVTVRFFVLFETIFSKMIVKVKVIMRRGVTLLLGLLVLCAQTSCTGFGRVVEKFTVIKSGRPFERM